MDIPQEELYTPPKSIAEVAEASYLLQNRTTTTSSLDRMGKINRLNASGPKLSIEQIQEQYDMKVNEPLTMFAAEAIRDEQKEVQRLQSIVDNAPNTLFGGMAVPFVAGVVGAMADPIDLGLGIATGAMFRAALAYKGFKAGKVAAFGIDAMDNVLTNSVTEALNMKATQKEQMEYAATDAFKNVLYGSIGFAALTHGGKYAVGKMFDLGSKTVGKLEKLTEIADANDKDISKVLPVAIEAIEKDLQIDEVFEKTVRDIFPDHQNELLQEGFDVRNVREQLIALEDEVSPEQVDKFLDTLVANGWDERKMYLLTEDVDPHLSPEAIVKIKEALNNPENDVNYINTKEIETLQRPINADDFEGAEKEIILENQRLQQFKDVDLVDEDLKADLEFHRKEVEEATVYTEAFEDYAVCMGYMAKEVVNG
jgi:hypothetical protein